MHYKNGCYRLSVEKSKSGGLLFSVSDSENKITILVKSQHTADILDLINRLGGMQTELQHLQRKVEHGCTDAFCPLCDV